MRRLLPLFFLGFLGCVSWSPRTNSFFLSQTTLGKGKYKVIRNVSAQVSAMYILGTLMLDDSQADLYKRAFEQIRGTADLQGKPRALANITTDIVVRNYLLVKVVELTVSADVIEFLQ